MGKKVLMVCLGNICRSPMAHGILQQKVDTLGLDVEVDSAGTAAYHVGEQPDPRAIEKMKRYGIDITYQRARQFNKDDFNDFDFIFAMDESNLMNMLSISDGRETSNTRMILNLTFPEQNMSVPDPYYGADDGFENVYQLLDAATDKVIELLNNEG